MTRDQFKKLKRGDIIKHKTTGNSFIIDTCYDAAFNNEKYIAVRTILVTNPSEWTKFKKEKK